MMAAVTAAQLSGLLQEQKNIIELNEDNPDVLTKAFTAVAKSMNDYFFVSDREVQSSEINESMAKFGWSWLGVTPVPSAPAASSCSEGPAALPRTQRACYRGCRLVHRCLLSERAGEDRNDAMRGPPGPLPRSGPPVAEHDI